jgi:hypothetical protein
MLFSEETRQYRKEKRDRDRERDREIERERQTGREGRRERERGRDRQTDRDRERETKTDRQTDRQTEMIHRRNSNLRIFFHQFAALWWNEHDKKDQRPKTEGKRQKAITCYDFEDGVKEDTERG